jgi:hypothetical protein
MTMKPLADRVAVHKKAQLNHSNTKKSEKKGTANKLKELYPEIASWHPVFVTQAWFRWRKVKGLPLDEPEDRNEEFPEYLVRTIQEKMKEIGTWR